MKEWSNCKICLFIEQILIGIRCLAYRTIYIFPTGGGIFFPLQVQELKSKRIKTSAYQVTKEWRAGTVRSIYFEVNILWSSLLLEKSVHFKSHCPSDGALEFDCRILWKALFGMWLTWQTRQRHKFSKKSSLRVDKFLFFPFSEREGWVKAHEITAGEWCSWAEDLCWGDSTLSSKHWQTETLKEEHLFIYFSFSYK